MTPEERIAREKEKTLLYFNSANDSLRAAVSFLISNMQNKSGVNDSIINLYSHYFEALSHWEELGYESEKDNALKLLYDSLQKQESDVMKIEREVMDVQCVSSDFLIQNVNSAYSAWCTRPAFVSSKWSDFCEYVLPYRVLNEPIEDYRKHYYNKYHQLFDSCQNAHDFLKLFRNEFYNNLHRRIQGELVTFPYDLPVSIMALGLKGDCRQNALFCAEIMRAFGVPTAIDFVLAWGNRSSGHKWNVLLLKDGIYPFEPFNVDSTILEYKPAKVFRHKYSISDINWNDSIDIPKELLNPCFEDVSSQYGKAFDIDVKIEYGKPFAQTKKWAIICVFDNKKWVPIWYGRSNQESMHFERMLGDVVYLAGFYVNGSIIPATNPFILTSAGETIPLNASESLYIDTMRVYRKYPRFKRMTYHAIKTKRSRIEASNDSNFHNFDKLYDVMFIPEDTAEIEIPKEKQKLYRYLRWNIVSYRTGDLAELVFYGKQCDIEQEHRLIGNIIGWPNIDDPHSYKAAMDGDYSTYFSKQRDSLGYVGLDLGPTNRNVLTKVRFYPRSDTNYIIPGEEYALFYWKDGQWVLHDRQIATCHHLDFRKTPDRTLFLLKNLTKGNEERIFTYEDGRQIWW